MTGTQQFKGKAQYLDLTTTKISFGIYAGNPH